MGDSDLSGELNEVDLTSKKLIPRAKMLTPKRDHSLAIYNGEIYSIGGFDSHPMVDCAKYIVATDTWTKLPNLNIARSCCASFVFDTEIYALAGYSLDYTNSMEKMSLSSPLKWEMVAFKDPFKERSMLHAMQISSSEVLVFGGCCVEGKALNEVFTLCFTESNIVFEKAENLPSACLFCNTSAPVCDGYRMYAMDSMGGLNGYSLKCKGWI